MSGLVVPWGKRDRSSSMSDKIHIDNNNAILSIQVSTIYLYMLRLLDLFVTGPYYLTLTTMPQSTNNGYSIWNTTSFWLAGPSL